MFRKIAKRMGNWWYALGSILMLLIPIIGLIILFYNKEA